MADIILTAFDTDGNSVILDLYQAESIAMSYKFTDLTDFAVRGGMSKQFRIPWTDRNSAFFGPLIDVTSTLPWFDFRKKTKATLSVGTMPIADGHIKIEKVYKTLEVYELEITFASKVPNLGATLADKKLSDLDHSSLDHVVDYSTIDSLDNVKWTLTDRGQKWSENPSDTGVRRIFNTASPVFPNDLTPIVNAKWIWQRIFTEAGFQYQSSVLDGIINDYWIPYVNSQAIQFGDLLNANFAVGGFDDGYSTFDGATVLPLVEIQDNGGNWSGSRFEAPLSGTYTFRLGATIKHTETGAVYSGALSLLKSSTIGDYWHKADGSIAFIGFQVSDTFTSFATDITIQMMAGDFVYVQKVVDSTLDGSVVFDRCEVLRTVAIGPVLDGFDFDGASNAPDMKQIDFVKSIIAMHNLAVIPDKLYTEKLNVEPLDTYIGSGEDYDYSNLVDISKTITMYPTTDLQSKNYFWTYKAGGEALSLYFTQQANRIYGDYRITNTGNEFASSDSKIELEFRSTPCNEVANTNIPIPKFIDSEGKFINCGPRIMFIGMHADLAIYNGTSGAIVSVPILSHYSNSNPSVSDYDLNFAPETPLQFIVSAPANTLFNLYWRRYYNELYSPESRIIEVYLKLTTYDIARLNFNDKLFINNTWWRILEINDYIVAGNESTLCKLAKIVDVLPECSLTVDHMLPTGQVIFSDGVTESDGNALCCEINGYTWNRTTSKCYAIQQTTPRR